MRSVLRTALRQLAAQAAQPKAASEAAGVASSSSAPLLPSALRCFSAQGASTSGRAVSNATAWNAASAWQLCQRQLATSSAALAAKAQPNTAGLKYWKPTSPGQRFRITIDRSDIWKGGPLPKLVKGVKRWGGRNRHGRITVRHRGGGHKRKLRMVDWVRRPPVASEATEGVVERLEYDPARSGYLALIRTPAPASGSGTKGGASAVPGFKYILAPQALKPGDAIQSGVSAAIKPGNWLPLRDIPMGMDIFNIELAPGRGGQICRSAGCAAQIMNKLDTHCIVRLPSGEQRLIAMSCHAAVGAVSNPQSKNRVIGKAGYNRHRGIRPTVRGIAMNPVDHPHGGRTNGGRASCTPWGLPCKGRKTRDRNKSSNKFVTLTRARSKGKLDRSAKWKRLYQAPTVPKA